MKETSKATKEQAATLVAEGRYEYGEIAEKVGVDVKTLHRWRKEPEFAAQVAELSAEFSEAAKKRALARKEYRLNTLANMHSRLLTVIQERAEDPEMLTVPGGTTGLVVRQPVLSGGQLFGYEYAVDTGTIKQVQSIQEQAAKELGQTIDRHEVVMPNVKDMSDEQLNALYKQLTGSDLKDNETA